MCYIAKGVFKVTSSVTLHNQFTPSGFAATVQRQSEWHCNPVKTTLQTAGGPEVFGVAHPAVHFACSSYTGNWQPLLVQAANEYGSANLSLQGTGPYCIPSWKSLTGPPGKTPKAPSGMSHFACYGIKSVVSGSYATPVITMKDEFDKTAIKEQIGLPSFICMPSAAHEGSAFYPINNSAGLLCLGAVETRHPATVWDENEFGTAKMTISKTVQELCVPSTVQIVT
jgi:hypothetical protein